MDYKRKDDERINKMQNDIEEIKHKQDETYKVLNRMEFAILGDKELGHKGLVNRTESNSLDIEELKSFKKLLCLIASFAGVIGGILYSLVKLLISYYK